MALRPFKKWRPQFACLIGNGFSVPYNSDLSVPNLAKGIVNEFSKLAGSHAEDALAAFAGKFHGFQSDDFESLLTPIESVGSALAHLLRLQALAASAPDALETAVKEAADFCKDVYRVGLGTALQLVAKAGAGKGGAIYQTTVVQPCRSIADLKSFGPVTVATLNYDGLLHSGFLDSLGSSALDDLSAGYETNALTPDGTNTLSCHPMRSAGEFRKESTVHLLNLHGSLAWLEDPVTGEVQKFQLQQLRNISYWDVFKAGKAVLNPVVVLTNRKHERVREAPFNLAYSVFETRLLNAERWLVAGYSFGDEPVNAVFRRCAAARSHWGKPAHVLVLNKGGQVADVAALAVAKLGLNEANVTVDLSGLPDSLGGRAWSAWAA